MYFKVCSNCGAHLDPEEKCDCEKGGNDEENKLSIYSGGLLALSQSSGRLRNGINEYNGNYYNSNYRNSSDDYRRYS